VIDREFIGLSIFINKSREIWLLHAFKKKTQKTPQQNIDLAKQRLKGIL